MEGKGRKGSGIGRWEMSCCNTVSVESLVDAVGNFEDEMALQNGPELSQKRQDFIPKHQAVLEDRSSDKVTPFRRGPLKKG